MFHSFHEETWPPPCSRHLFLRAVPCYVQSSFLSVVSFIEGSNMITKSEVEYASNAFRAHYAGEINTTQKSPVILDLYLRKKLAVQPELSRSSDRVRSSPIRFKAWHLSC